MSATGAAEKNVRSALSGFGALRPVMPHWQIELFGSPLYFTDFLSAVITGQQIEIQQIEIIIMDLSFFSSVISGFIYFEAPLLDPYGSHPVHQDFTYPKKCEVHESRNYVFYSHILSPSTKAVLYCMLHTQLVTDNMNERMLPLPQGLVPFPASAKRIKVDLCYMDTSLQ